MRNIAFILFVLCICSSCSVTLTGSAKWSEPVGGNSVSKDQYDKLVAEARGFASEISAAADSTDGVKAVLRKYGVQKP